MDTDTDVPSHRGAGVLLLLRPQPKAGACHVRRSYNRLLKKPMAEYLAQDSCALPANYGRLISLFRNTNQAFPFDGNRVEVYTRGLP